MIVRALLRQLQLKGIELWAEQGKLKFKAPKGAMSAQIKQLIQANKPTLLASLDPGGDLDLDAMLTDQEQQNMPFALTPIQTAYLLGRNSSFELGGVGAHYYCELLLEQGPDYARFCQIIARLIEHYDALRLVITEDHQQKILAQAPTFQPAAYDCSGLPPLQFEQQLETLRKEESHRCYEANQWPLFNFSWIKQPEGQIRILVSIDLLIMDAMSGNNLVTELQACCRNSDYELPSVPSLRDYCVAMGQWQETRYDESMNYWESKLASLPSAPQLPRISCVENCAKQQYRRLCHRLTAQQWERLQQYARELQSTPSAILLTLFCRVLASWSTKPDFSLNVTLFNRPPLHPDADKLWGELTTTSLVTFKDEAVPFAKQFTAIQHQLMDCVEYGSVSGVELIGMSQHHQPGKATMPVVFTSLLHNSGLASGEAKEVYAVSQTPQVALDHQVYLRNGELLLNWDVAEGYFVEGVVDEMFRHYSQMAEQLLASDPKDHQALWHAEYFAPTGEFLTVREQVNNTECDLPWQPLHHPFFAEAESRPDQIALSSTQGDLTYRALADWAKAIAVRLQRQGIKPRQGVAVAISKSPAQIAAVLGILAAGAYYVPVAADSPLKRKQQILRNAQVSAVCVADTKVDPKVDSIASLKSLPNIECHPAQDSEWDDIARFVVDKPSPESLAYIIYTSGSTGQPKGVALSHQAVSNTLLDVSDRIDLNENDAVYGLSALNFDLSVFDVFATFSVGAQLVLPDPERLRDPGYWLAQLRQHHVSVWNSVPMLAEMLVTYCEQQNEILPGSLKAFLLSGDWIPLDLPQRLRCDLPRLKVVGMGGATEAAIWSNWFDIQEIGTEWRSIPYGKPLLNQAYHVLDAQLHSRPDWVTGDLYISGMGLADGYWGDEEKTAASFFYHPETGERLYCTGDLARYWPDGTIEFLGRDDQQVKLGGHRIELGEIETALMRHPTIKQACVQLNDHTPPAIVAWLVAEGVAQVEQEVLEQFLAQWLPEYMQPRGVRWLSSLPLTANGKVNYKALPNVTLQVADVQSLVPKSPLEQQMCELLALTLNRTALCPVTRYFEQGVGSLELVKFHGALVSSLDVRVDITDLFTYPSVRELTLQLETRF